MPKWSDDMQIQNGLPNSNSFICWCSVARVVYTCNGFVCSFDVPLFFPAVVVAFAASIVFASFFFVCVCDAHCTESTARLCTWICTFYCHFVTHGEAFISNNALIRVNLWTVSRKCHIRFGDMRSGRRVNDACKCKHPNHLESKIHVKSRLLCLLSLCCSTGVYVLDSVVFCNQ